MDWVERAEELLYDGESVREQVRVGAGGVVVTSHRVLAFTPDREGSNYRAVDRPNVDGVGYETSGELPFLRQAVKAIVVGLVLLAAGMTVSLDSLVSGIDLNSGGTAGAVGLGRMMGLMQTMLSLLAQLDDLMRLFGGRSGEGGTDDQDSEDEDESGFLPSRLDASVLHSHGIGEGTVEVDGTTEIEEPEVTDDEAEALEQYHDEQ